MEFSRLLEIVADEPAFDTGLLMAGHAKPADAHRQLSRWTAAGRLYQLRRGLYTLAPPFQKVKPHPFVLANRMVNGSYVSCQSALAYHGLIPEHVPVVTSVTGTRPARWDTPLGRFEYRHVKPALRWGYRFTSLDDRQGAFVATPEKGLLDLIYLRPGGDTSAYVRELRLQNFERLNLDELRRQAERSGSAKLQRAIKYVVALARDEKLMYETL